MYCFFFWSRLFIHPHGVEGAHNFLGNSANTDLIRQAKGVCTSVPTPTLETKQTSLNSTISVTSANNNMWQCRCQVLIVARCFNHSFVVTMLIIAPHHAMYQVNLLDETLRITKMVLTKFMANFIKHKCVH